MFTFTIERYVPEFILADKNGYALAKAIETGMQLAIGIIDEGVKCIYDYDSMPEWRLDELAWETNCLYDYHADVETKRNWIRNAIPLYRLFGTQAAIYNYVGSYFDSIEVEEGWQYEGNPFHFRVTVDGEWTPENEVWARKAIEQAKNVRSVLDALAIGSKSFIGLTAEGEVLGRFAYPLTGPSNYAGRWPQENYIGVLDTSARMGAEGRAKGYQFPYPAAGTRPEINTLGVLDKGGRAAIAADAAGYRFDYPVTSENLNAGTVPQVNTIGVLSANNIQSAQAEDTYATILYKLCGQDEI